MLSKFQVRASQLLDKVEIPFVFVKNYHKILWRNFLVASVKEEGQVMTPLWQNSTNALRVINTVCRNVSHGNCRGNKQICDPEKENTPLPKRRRYHK